MTSSAHRAPPPARSVRPRAASGSRIGKPAPADLDPRRRPRGTLTRTRTSAFWGADPLSTPQPIAARATRRLAVIEEGAPRRQKGESQRCRRPTFPPPPPTSSLRSRSAPGWCRDATLREAHRSSRGQGTSLAVSLPRDRCRSAHAFFFVTPLSCSASDLSHRTLPLPPSAGCRCVAALARAASVRRTPREVFSRIRARQECHGAAARRGVRAHEEKHAGALHPCAATRPSGGASGRRPRAPPSLPPLPFE